MPKPIRLPLSAALLFVVGALAHPVAHATVTYAVIVREAGKP